MHTKNTRTHRVQLTLVATLSILSGNTYADANFDQEKVSMCVACHGADGIGKANQYPSLQGLPVDYIVAQLKAFQSGARPSPTMGVVTKSLSDREMQMLAKFFHQVQ